MCGVFFQTQRSIVQINKKGSLSGNKKRQIFGFKTRQREKESKGGKQKRKNYNLRLSIKLVDI